MLLDDQQIARQKYHVTGTPVTVIIDNDGKAIFRHLGYSDGDEVKFEKEVQLLMER